MLKPKLPIKNIVSILNRNGVELGFVFGSVLTEYFNKDSDIDIGVLFPKSFSIKKRFQLRVELINQLSKILKRQVDLVVLNDVTSLLLKFVVISEGRLIYSSSEDANINYQFAVMTEYHDFKPFLDMYNQHYVQKNTR